MPISCEITLVDGLPPLQWSRVVGFRAAQLIGAQHGKTRVSTRVPRKVLDLVEAGRPIAEVAQALGISDQSIYTWRRQDRIDRGLEPGLISSEKAELAAAKRHIVELETELQAMRRAMELVREVVPPKGGSRRSQ
jgi:transposase